MRPVNKGPDKGTFKPYGNAQEPLKTALGRYCSYCERWIASAIHVEHKLPKDDYPGRKYRWTNFLLSCANCNSGKSSGQIKLRDYLWPDQDNTFAVFVYDIEGRVTVRPDLSSTTFKLAENLWKMIGLNRHPDIASPGMQQPTDKDDRWLDRKYEWVAAEEKKSDLAILDTPARRDLVAREATRRGMFSIWMAVFHDDRDMRLRIIKAFEGTDSSSFDLLGNARRRSGGQY
nr:HNH endonuclease [uncultured Pseudogulbenkiania sp.]